MKVNRGDTLWAISKRTGVPVQELARLNGINNANASIDMSNRTDSIIIPTGNTAQRPSNAINGTIRYNSEIGEFEVYNSQHPNSPNFTPWEILRTVRQATITPQNLGYGNYVDYIFGPLSYSVDINKPQNVLVFVDNVYQTPNTNYK